MTTRAADWSLWYRAFNFRKAFPMHRVESVVLESIVDLLNTDPTCNRVRIRRLTLGRAIGVRNKLRRVFRRMKISLYGR
jgi:hypothetical protein